MLVETRLRDGVADPEGATIERSLPALGFDGVWIHHVGKRQQPFLDVFGEHVLPALRAT